MVDHGELELLSVLKADERVELLRHGLPREYRPGEVLMREGDPSNFAVLLVSGQVKVTAAGPDGSEVFLAHRDAGDILGELSMIDGQPRSATVVALTPVTATVVSAEIMNDFLDQHPPLMRRLLFEVVGRLREAGRQHHDQVSYNVLTRVAMVLIKLAEDVGEPAADGIAVRQFSQHELAGRAGSSRAAVVKALNVLRGDGLVSTGRRQVVVHNLDKLRVLAQQ